MNSVRLSVKAIIVSGRRILALRCSDDEGDWYMLPGGGLVFGETVHEALVRECREEIGAEVSIGSLRFVRDYIAKNHEFASTDSDFHQVELWFECELGSELSEPVTPDTMQLGVEWLELDRLSMYRLYPKILQKVLLEKSEASVVYLGDVN